jgi:Heterokaryon incompatibility protein (HET)
MLPLKMEPLQSFEYNPLDPDPGLSQIRLVYLLPPRTTEQISDRLQLRCSIETVSLKTNPKYTALSYTWGDPSRTSPLMINEGIKDPINSGETALYITKSVETALLHLRHSTSTRVFWIDQLCINQDNKDERSSQVQLMKAIYEGARDVIVWLGPAAHESDHLIDILTEVGKEACKAGILKPDSSILERNQAFRVSYSELTKTSSLGLGFTISRESLRSFVDREWWKRVWVVQELSLACSVTFACGDRRISYEHLRNALYFYVFYSRQQFNDFRDRRSKARIYLDPKKRQEFFALASAPVDSAADKMLTSRYRYRRQIESNGGYSLYRILEISHVIHYSETRLKATDNRDKIFGLLGLAGDVQQLGIRPDYKKDDSKVYIEVARALIACGHVDLLWFCQFPKSNDLPTWAPDWSADIKTPYGDKFSESSRPFAASGTTTAHIDHTEKIEGSNRFITLHGAFVDKVDVIGSEWVKPPDEDFNVAAAYRFIQEINLLCDEVSTNGTRQDPRILEETRWRTPIGDKEWNDNWTAQRATELSCKVYEELLRRIEMRSALDRPPEQWLRWFLHIFTTPFLLPKLGFPLETKAGMSYFNFMKEMYNRRPLRTKDGYVGLGPVGMLPNDMVCIILGAQVPYVLRPCEAGWYQLVG